MKHLYLVGVAALLGLASCAVTLDMPEPDEGRALFVENCAICHGADGKGNGELADDLSPKPADLTMISARNKGRFPRTKVLSIIDGYTRMQSDGENMPEFGLLLDGDTIPLEVDDSDQQSPVPRPLAALVVYLESIQH